MEIHNICGRYRVKTCPYFLGREDQKFVEKRKETFTRVSYRWKTSADIGVAISTPRYDSSQVFPPLYDSTRIVYELLCPCMLHPQIECSHSLSSIYFTECKVIIYFYIG